MKTTCRPFAAVSFLGFFCALLSPAASSAIDEYEQKPIEYSRATPDNRISRIKEKLDRGELKLEYDYDHFGYLPAFLKALEIDVDTQTLVFSKTSKQRNKIAPRLPRSIYFNDDTYIGFCQDGDIVEITAVDPQLGGVFYSLDQHDPDVPKIERHTDNCTLCHASSHIGSVPGHLVRSLYVDSLGFPILAEGSKNIDHTSAFEQRWGGWYVSGKHGGMKHLGNLIIENAAKKPYVNDDGQNVTDLGRFFPVDICLTPHSDIVALMVLEHQGHVHNLLTQANFTAKQALAYEEEFKKSLGEPENGRLESTVRRIRNAGDKLLLGMLFAEEAKLTATVVGTSNFAARFAAEGPFDQRGRSLRQFDLQSRMFRYPLSYLIYGDSFDGLPPEMKRYVAGKLLGLLNGTDTDPRFSHLSQTDRRNLLEILRDTKPELWKLAAAETAE